MKNTAKITATLLVLALSISVVAADTLGRPEEDPAGDSDRVQVTVKELPNGAIVRIVWVDKDGDGQIDGALEILRTEVLQRPRRG